MSRAVPLDQETGDGGVPARRAVIRWAWRLYRREWRQQILVLALLTVAVAAAITGASAAYNLAPARGNAEFGTANHFIRLDASDPQTLQADLDTAGEWFGTIDVIAHRHVPIPGSVETVEYRGQDPHGPYSGPMLALRDGRYPAAAGEAAVTDAIAEIFALRIGSSFALDGTARTIVGVVENPSDLGDEFALLYPSLDAAPGSVTILVRASIGRAESFRSSGDGALGIGRRPTGEGAAAALGVLAVATLGMLLVGLVAASGFVVMAQRRLRQLGMLAAIGATEAHLRLVTVANGAIIGAVAALIGAATGAGIWLLGAPRIENGVGHRIDPLNVPWWMIVAAMLLAVATATGAAWWPARAAARVPVVHALSGRPPRPRPARHAPVPALLLLAVGVLCLARFDPARVGDESAEPFGDPVHALLLAVGTIAIVLGTLLIAPLALRLVAGPAARLPVAVRLALRDLARYQSRSGAALAAISLALGIPVAIIVTSAVAEQSAGDGNLAENQLLVWTRNASDPEGVSPFYTQDPNDEGFSPFIPEWTPAEVEALEEQVTRIAASLDGATTIPLDVAIDPAMAPDPRFPGQPAVTLARRAGDGYNDVGLLYVASPELLAHYGLDLRAAGPATEILTVESGEIHLTGTAREPGTPPEAVDGALPLTVRYFSIPGSFITLEAVQQRGWQPVRVGWLVETSAPLTPGQLATARGLAAGGGLLIESRREEQSLAGLRSRAAAAGTLLALAVLAMTVGLIRGEAAGDLRTLAAAGATSTIRRTLTGATAGALALLGAALGIGGAYLGLAAVYLDGLGALSPVPILHLLAIAAGAPLAAAIAGWLLAGNEPPTLARPPLE